MAFRFRRSLKIAPGFRINLSKSGPSLSVGGRGFHRTFSRRGERTTVGIPGSGLSYSTSHTRRRRAQAGNPVVNFFIGLAVIVGLAWWLL